MENYKSVLTSKTVWGSIITVLAVLAPNLGIDHGVVDELVALFGAAFSIYGRIVATTKIDSVI